MDQASLSDEHRAQALSTLNGLNRGLGVHRRTCHHLQPLLDRCGSVLELGSGGGGLLGYARQRHAEMTRGRLIGLDISAAALQRARAWQGDGIGWVQGDARRVPLADNSVDAVTCSLFLHHFDEDEVVHILRESARVARRGIVISDLTRSRTALLLTWLFVHVFCRSVVVHYDAPLSVRAALTPGELRNLARQAGLDGAVIRRQAPFRMTLVWNKPEPRVR